MFLTRVDESPVLKINEISCQWCMNANWRAISVSSAISSHIEDIVITRWRHVVLISISIQSNCINNKENREGKLWNNRLYVDCFYLSLFLTSYRTFLLTKMFIQSKIEFAEKSRGKHCDTWTRCATQSFDFLPIGVENLAVTRDLESNDRYRTVTNNYRILY